MPRTLVVSAFEPEIAPLRRRLAGRRDVQTSTVGIGAVDAAIGAALAIAAYRPGRVIFVGTAGVYSRGRAAIPIGGVAVAGQIQAVSTAVLRGDGYLPAPVVHRCDASAAPTAALSAALGGAPQSVACPLAITRTAALGRLIAEATGADLESLELFAVARAARAAGVELGAVLGVANRVGPGGHREWLKHHRAVSRAACDLIYRVLSAPVTGRQRRASTSRTSG